MMKFKFASIKSLSLFCALALLICGSLSFFCPMMPDSAEASSLPVHHSSAGSDNEGGCFDSLVSSMSAWELEHEAISLETSTLSILPPLLSHSAEKRLLDYLYFDGPPRYLFLSTFLI